MNLGYDFRMVPCRKGITASFIPLTDGNCKFRTPAYYAPEGRFLSFGELSIVFSLIQETLKNRYEVDKEVDWWVPIAPEYSSPRTLLWNVLLGEFSRKIYLDDSSSLKMDFGEGTFEFSEEYGIYTLKFDSKKIHHLYKTPETKDLLSWIREIIWEEVDSAGS